MKPFFVTIPHSGELIPAEASWLTSLPEVVVMRDVDRYVDQLYYPAIQTLHIPSIVAQCHRYVIDLNRLSDDYDLDAVKFAPHPSGKHPKGLHWSVTTFGEKLINEPMSQEVHRLFVDKHYRPFHDEVKKMATSFDSPQVFHIDAHSMPSQGTPMHNDPGEKRADIVVSDFHGKSSRKDFVDLIITSYKEVGFQVAYNWPYFGGGITQMYGKPEAGHHTVQVELNRALYMNEDTKKLKVDAAKQVEFKLLKALEKIQQNLPQ